MFLLECHWNYNHRYCVFEQQHCLKAAKNGIKLLHGYAKSFNSLPHTVFYKIYNFFQRVSSCLLDSFIQNSVLIFLFADFIKLDFRKDLKTEIMSFIEFDLLRSRGLCSNHKFTFIHTLLGTIYSPMSKIL